MTSSIGISTGLREKSTDYRGNTMNFKNYISKRMDNLLKKEELNPPLVKYIDIDISDKLSQYELKKTCMDLIAEASNPVVYDVVHHARNTYGALIEFILMVDMPLTELFNTEEFNLKEVYDRHDDVPPPTVITGFVEALGRAFKNPLDEVQLFEHLKWAHLFYIGVAKRLGVTAESLIA